MGQIITNNLDGEFQKAKEDKYVEQTLSSLPVHQREMLKKEMKKRAQSGATSSSVFNTFFSPFRVRSSIEAPTKRKDLNEWYRFYYKHDPIVGTAIDLHVEFPLSSFSITHDDPEIERFFNDVKEETNLEYILFLMGLEYYVVGECFPFGFVDNPADPKTWTAFILLDPDFIRINTHPFVRGRKNFNIMMKPDADLKKIVTNGPKDKNTGPLYHDLPPDIIDLVKKNKDIPLEPLQVSHVKRTGNPFNVRGESIISRVMFSLMYRDKLKDAQWAIADRHVCHDEQTECLTKEGWKKHTELSKETEIATFNRETGALEYQKPEFVYVNHYKGDMIKFGGAETSKKLDILYIISLSVLKAKGYHWLLFNHNIP